MFCKGLKFSCRWLREFIDDPFRGHVALIEFLQYLHLNQPPSGDSDVGKRKGRPDVLARDFVSDREQVQWLNYWQTRLRRESVASFLCGDRHGPQP